MKIVFGRVGGIIVLLIFLTYLAPLARSEGERTALLTLLTLEDLLTLDSSLPRGRREARFLLLFFSCYCKGVFFWRFHSRSESAAEDPIALAKKSRIGE